MVGQFGLHLLCTDIHRQGGYCEYLFRPRVLITLKTFVEFFLMAAVHFAPIKQCRISGAYCFVLHYPRAPVT